MTARGRRKNCGTIVSRLLGVLFVMLAAGFILLAIWLAKFSKTEQTRADEPSKIEQKRVVEPLKTEQVLYDVNLATLAAERDFPGFLQSGSQLASPAEPNSRSAIEDVAESEYFYIEEYGPLVGGSGLDIETTYLDKKGLLQKSVEHDGEILALTEYRVQTEVFFRELAGTIHEMPKEVKFRGQEPSEAISEYYPPHVIIYANLNKFGRYVWAGKKDSVPDSIQGILEVLKKIKEEPEKSSQITPGPYIRGCLLDERTAEEFRKANLFKILTEADFTKNPYIKKAVENPFYLIHIEDSDNPFATFRKEFTPGRDDIELLFRGDAFQIRSLILQKQQKSKNKQ
jgi:hypothetical protein